ncbi:Telomerase-binding protein EST1A [Acipenser ruthenus]|uniref:Telomerase-binding protein EST1A n=1 Tax=Acipenser ruthenus TaxID=7906 RepID=A0A444UZK3_ACIRT|nr:Telomerase-binding protein EST1A [Acipenser ruthenus]
MEEDSESDASGSEDDFRELRARKHALTVKVAEQQRRRDKIQGATPDSSPPFRSLEPLPGTAVWPDVHASPAGTGLAVKEEKEKEKE